MLEAHLLPVFIRLIDAILSGIFHLKFLTPKPSRKFTAVLWALIFFLIGTLILEPYTNGDSIGILIHIAVIFLMQLAFFQKNYAKQFFVALTFIAGKYIINYITCVVFLYTCDIRSIIINYVIKNEFIKTVEQSKILSHITNVFHYGLGALIYALIFSLFLFFISKKYVCQNHNLSLKESIYLIFPCITSLCIYITLRKLILSVGNGKTLVIFDTFPETKIWVATISFLLLGTIVATDMLFQYFVQYNDENRKRIILENQVIQTRKEVSEIEDIYSDMRGLRHDMQSHINSILLYVRNKGKNSDELERYIGKMQDTIDRFDFSYHCGNPIIDIIIHQAQQLAKRENISFDVNFIYPKIKEIRDERSSKSLHLKGGVRQMSDGGVTEPEKTDSLCHIRDNIDVYDIAVILNNALENAFEACKKVDDEKSINLRSFLKGNLFFIEIENDFKEQITFNKTTGFPESSKLDKKLHGIGLSNIQKCAKKYFGDIDIEISSNNGCQRFNLTVMMKLPSS